MGIDKIVQGGKHVMTIVLHAWAAVKATHTLTIQSIVTQIVTDSVVIHTSQKYCLNACSDKRASYYFVVVVV